MSEASIVAIVLGAITFIGGYLTTRAQQRKDALAAAFQLIDELRQSIKAMQEDADRERTLRRRAEETMINLQKELNVTRRSLEEQTQSRIDRERTITDLRERLERVEKKTGPLDPGKAT